MPRPLTKKDAGIADMIIGMEPMHHIEFCLRFFRWRRKFLLVRTLEDRPESLRLSDPYGEDETAFRRCYKSLAADAEILLSLLEGGTGPEINPDSQAFSLSHESETTSP